MGVRPPHVKMVYTGKQAIEGEFEVIPYGDKNIRISVAESGLKEYISFENSQKELTIHMSSPTRVKYYLLLPDNLKPGEYRTEIICNQYMTPEEKVQLGGFARAIAAVAFVVVVRVPNEGKFLEAELKIEPQKISIGDPIYLTINILNFGTEELSDIQSDIIITDPTGKTISTKKTTKVNLLKPAQTDELRTFWETKGVTAGFYSAESEIAYGGKAPTFVRTDLRIGDILIKIVNVTSILNESIAKIFIDVKSNWNDNIENVYAELSVKNGNNVIDKIKTSAINLEPWGEGRLTAFWEKGSLAAGEYDIDINVYYYDKLAQEQLKVNLEELEKKAPEGGKESPLLIIAVILLAFILIVNVLIMFRNFSKKKKK
jgi:hypothetical protein